MFEFYRWSLAERGLITLLLVFCVTAQTAATILSYYRRPYSRARLGETLLELSVLIQILTLSLLQGQGQQAQYSSILVHSGYVTHRYIAAAFAALMACLAFALQKKAWPLLIVAVSCMTLPATEAVSGRAYVWLYIGALLIWLLRSLRICILRYHEVRTGISALSIKNTLDNLRTGVLFSEPDGFILLANGKMQELMSALAGRIQRNARDFHEQLLAGELRPGCRKEEEEGQTVYILPDEAAWMFSRTELRIRRKLYIQLTATDITERWALTAELRKQEELLKRSSGELTETIGNLHMLSREKEIQRAKLHTHDLLGQRLTLMLRTMRNELDVDIHLLQAQSRGLLDDLKAGQAAISPQEEFDSLREVYGVIGVKISLEGELPGDDRIGSLFADVISEGAANAVRHGFATEVNVRIWSEWGGWYVEITDNGSPPDKPVAEGSGLSGLREKVEREGGGLRLTAHPRFTLRTEIPGDE